MNNLFLGIKNFVKIVLLVIGLWLIYHIFAIFGFYLVIAYLIWWLFAPQRAVCLFCQTKSEGSRCPLCRRTIKKISGTYPKTVRSALLNALAVFIFSILSLGLVFVESQVISGWLSSTKTVSFSAPNKTEAQYRLGEIFPMRIEVGGIEEPINAIQADFSFDPQRLELLQITTDGSFASIFLQREINNDLGYARLTGGLPNPGFSGERGLFGTAYFRGKMPGLTQVKFLPSSMVLANDRHGKNILKDYVTISYLILPQTITAEEASLQEKLPVDTQVLGATSNEAQLILFERTGIFDTQQERDQRLAAVNYQSDLFMAVLETIYAVDQQILRRVNSLSVTHPL